MSLPWGSLGMVLSASPEEFAELVARSREPELWSRPLEIVTGFDAAVAEWVRQRVPHIVDFGPSTAIGIARGPDLVAGLVYHNREAVSIEATIAATSPHWCSRRILAALFYFPFYEVGCRRLGTVSAAGDRALRRFLDRLGFEIEGLARQRLPPSAVNPSGDALFWGMSREDCRWLPGSNGHRRRGASAQQNGGVQ